MAHPATLRPAAAARPFQLLLTTGDLCCRCACACRVPFGQELLVVGDADALGSW